MNFTETLNKNLLKERDSYLTHDENTSQLDVTKGVHPLIDINVLKEANQNMIKQVLDNFGYEYMDLSENGLYHKFKQVISKRYEEFDIQPQNIVLGHGSFHIVERIFTKVLKSNTKLLGVGPQFNELPDEFRRMEGNVYETVYKKGDETPQLDLILEKLKVGNDYNCIYLDNPNNPTGKILDNNSVEEILKEAEKKGVIVILDEAYGDFMENEKSGAQFIKKYQNVLVVKSMSKGYGLARDRIGYCMGNEDIIKIISQAFVPFEPSEKGLILGTKMMNDYQKLNLSEVKDKKENLLNILDINGIEYSGTDTSVPIMLLKHKNIYQKFLEKGVNTIPGNSYSETNPNMNNDMCRIVMPKDKEKYDKFIKIIGEIKG